jgi:hypothetical protein
MFKSPLAILSAGGIFAFTLLAAPLAQGEESRTTVTTSTGTISEIGPDRLIIQSRTESAPLRYRFTRTTAYVDETGAPVAAEVVRSGLPVTVEYARDGEELVATRVIVQRQTAPAGATVIERNTTITPPPQVVEKKVYVDRPVVVEKRVPVEVEKKVYVDRPVIVEKPVPVDRTVIVEKPAPRVVVPAPQVIEEKKTTTTITTTEGRK